MRAVRQVGFFSVLKCSVFCQARDSFISIFTSVCLSACPVLSALKRSGGYRDFTTVVRVLCFLVSGSQSSLPCTGLSLAIGRKRLVCSQCVLHTRASGLSAEAICWFWRQDFNMLVTGLLHILSCLSQLSLRQRIFLEFRKKSKSKPLCFVIFKLVLLCPGSFCSSSCCLPAGR